MSQSGSDARSGIGARLRAGRERMGLTLLQAAEKLHVDPKVVECLEAERFDALGAPVFVKGHLKRYAELTGEQAAQLIEIYNAATKPALPDLTRLPKAAPETKPGRLAVPSLAVLIGFVVIGVVGWVIKSMPEPGEAAPAARAARVEPEMQVVPESLPPESLAQPSPADTAGGAATAGGDRTGSTSPGAPVQRAGATSPSAPPPGAATTTSPGTPPPGAGTTTSPGTPPPGAGTTTSPGASPPRAGTTSPGAPPPRAGATLPGATSATSASSSGGAIASGPGTAGTPAPVTGGATSAGASTSPEAGSAGASAPAAGRSMQVKLRFAADSWVEIYDSKGERIFADVGTADSEHTVTGTPPLRVTFGNAPGVSLDVNGKPATVPANLVSNDSAQFTINRSGRIVRARPQADGG